MQEDGHVLVVGAAGIDIKVTPEADHLAAETSTPGHIRNSVGGVARNIAENLARLETPTVLLSAVGDDPPGRLVLNQTEASGVDISNVLVAPRARTGTWMGLMHRNGQLRMAVDDYSVMKRLTPRYLYDRRRLFAEASMVVIDANLEEKALESVFKLATRYDLRVCADPTSASLTGRLCGLIDQIYMITPNIREATALCGVEVKAHNRDTAMQAARQLVMLGAQIAVVTMGAAGLVYATVDSSGYIPALGVEVVDSTGAGDAFSAGAIFGILNDIPIDEAMRLGVSAAALTLQTPDTVVSNLSLELLYDQLV
ncbi:MAG: carbohydrate kinase family protein [Anaerolineae bacterium]|nr:carbohydrate kinase family protein [Anaerolineae bacterium]